MDAWLIATMTEIEAIKTEIEGMKAANEAATSRGEVPAFEKAHFDQKAEELWNMANLIRRTQ